MIIVLKMNSITLTVLHFLLAAAAFRISVSAGCPGCSSDVSDPNSKDIRDVIARTLGKTNAGYTLTNVKKCKSQVVAGMKYDCEIEIKSPSGQISECQLSVIQRPWLKDDKEQIISESCSSISRTKRDLPPSAYTYVPKPSVVDCNTQKDKIITVLQKQDPSLTYVNGTYCVDWVLMVGMNYLGVQYNNTIQVTSPKLQGIHTCILSFVLQPWGHSGTYIEQDTCSQLARKKRDLPPSVYTYVPKRTVVDCNRHKDKIITVLQKQNPNLTYVNGTYCVDWVLMVGTNYLGVQYNNTIQVTSPKLEGVHTCILSFVLQPWGHSGTYIEQDTCSQLASKESY